MSLPSRLIIGIASLILISTYFLPVWFIFLIAPQYPEGLTMQIWFDKITGQVDIINGLNHYIGMKHISVEMFPEFDFLVYIVGFYILFGLVVAITGNRKLLFAYLILTVIGGAAAMYDFYRWGYDYGHNLDPKAAIQVPGLTYQPPMFGHKTLLNFDAYSYPDIGGWIVIGVGVTFFIVYFYEWWKHRKRTSQTKVTRKKAGTVATILFFFIASCSTKPEPFVTGKDSCTECKMTIMDPRFGSQIITRKGKIYKFDDAHCLLKFIKAGTINETEISQTVFTDFSNPTSFVDVKAGYFVTSPELKSPMNSHTACFADKAAAEKLAASSAGSLRNWEQLLKAP